MVAQVVAPDLRSLALVLLASSLGALLSRLSRRIVLPTVVVEIVLGILIGPAVLGIAEVDPYLQYLSTLGLALLFFFVGLEVVEHKRAPTRRSRGARGAGRSRSPSASPSGSRFSCSGSTPGGGCWASR